MTFIFILDTVLTIYLTSSVLLALLALGFGRFRGIFDVILGA